MYKKKYLKYKKKYLELKENMVGNGHSIYQLDSEPGFWKHTDTKKWTGEMKGQFIKDTSDTITAPMPLEFDGVWNGSYTDYNEVDEFKGTYTKKGENTEIKINKIGVWDNRDLTYYGIYNDKVKKSINNYIKKNNDHFSSRFKWYTYDSYLQEVIHNKNEYLQTFNDNFGIYNGWRFAQGYGDGLCSMYAFLLGIEKISKINYNYPTIMDNDENEKNIKTNLFATETILPIFEEIFDNYKNHVMKNKSKDVTINITLNSGKINKPDVTKYDNIIEKNGKYELNIFNKCDNDKKLKNDKDALEYCIVNNFILSIDDNIYHYLSIINNINILVFRISFMVIDPRFYFCENKEHGYKYSNRSLKEKEIIFLRRYTMIIYTDGDHYYVMDNNNDITKYKFLKTMITKITEYDKIFS